MKKIILVYHGIGNTDKFLEVQQDAFERQIKYLQKKQFKFVHCDEILKYKKGNIVSIMFDDALSSSETAIKYMETNNLKYSIAIIENYVNKKDNLKWEQLTTYKYAKLVFHTLDHYDLASLSKKDQEFQLNCKNDLINSKVVVYPMGKYNSDTIDILKQNGAELGMTVLPFHVTKKANKYMIPRICINGYLSMNKYKLFLTKLGNLYLHLAFIKRKILNQSYLDK